MENNKKTITINEEEFIEATAKATSIFMERMDMKGTGALALGLTATMAMKELTKVLFEEDEEEPTDTEKQEATPWH